MKTWKIYFLSIVLLPVNNVGVCSDHPIPFHEMSTELILNHVRVNVTGTLLMTRMILPQMRHRNKGAIINVSSLVEFVPWPFFAPYSASKVSEIFWILELNFENTKLWVSLMNIIFDMKVSLSPLSYKTITTEMIMTMFSVPTTGGLLVQIMWSYSFLIEIWNAFKVREMVD